MNSFKTYLTELFNSSYDYQLARKDEYERYYKVYGSEDEIGIYLSAYGRNTFETVCEIFFKVNDEFQKNDANAVDANFNKIVGTIMEIITTERSAYSKEYTFEAKNEKLARIYANIAKKRLPSNFRVVHMEDDAINIERVRIV